MEKAFIICKDVWNIYPDEMHGLLYCYNYSTKVYVVDTDSGKIVGNFKVGRNTLKLYFNETKEFLFVHGCDSKITVWQVNKYDEPYWRINLKGTVNSDFEFVCKDNIMYGYCDSCIKSAAATRYFIIDLISREIKTEICPFFCPYRKNSVGGEVHDAVEKIYDAGLEIQQHKLRELYAPIPEEYIELYNLDKNCPYYKTDKFAFLNARPNLIAIPHGAQLNESIFGVKQKKDPHDFTEEYIKTHGLTKEFLDEADDGEILYFGYFWALEQIENKSKTAGISFEEFLGNETISDVENILYSVGWFQTEIDEGGIEQYFYNGEIAEFDSLIKALKVVNANQTATAIKRCVAIQNRYNGLQNPSEKDEEMRVEKIEDVWGDVTEDYALKATEYVKRVILSQ